MTVPRFDKGETLSADKLNALAEAVREAHALATSALIRDTSGGLTFERSSAGTTLSAVPIPSRRAGDDSDSSAAGTTQGNYRRLFRWSSDGTEQTDALGNTSLVFTVEVSSGLAFLRPHQVKGTTAGGVGLYFQTTTETLTGFTAKLPKKVYSAELIENQCEGVSVITDLVAAAETDSEGVASVAAKITVPVPRYKLTRTGTQSVATSISTGTGSTTKRISFDLPAQTLTSGTEFLTGVTLSLASKTLSANPVGQDAWTHTLVLFSGSKAVPTAAKVRVSSAAKTLSTNVDIPTTTVSANFTDIPTGYTMTETTSENVEKEVSFRVAKSTATISVPTGVRISEETDGTEDLEIVGNGAIEIPDFGRMNDGDASDFLSGEIPDAESAEPAQLYHVAGATFSYDGKNKLVWLNVVVSAGGTPQFYWSQSEVPSLSADGTEIATDEPQVLKAAVASAFQLIEGSNGGFRFGVAAGTRDAWEAGNWRASVPMAVIWAGDEGPEVEALTHGCVEFKPRVKIEIGNGGASCEGIATLSVNVPTAFPELEAEDFQLV